MMFEAGTDITAGKITGSEFFHCDCMKLSCPFVAFALLIVLLPVVCAAQDAGKENKVTGETLMEIQTRKGRKDHGEK